MRDQVDYGEPIPRLVVAEVLQLLGYEQNNTLRVAIQGSHVTVVTAEVIDHQVIDVMHSHTII